MPKEEGTPIVIDFKSANMSGYGAADSGNVPSSSNRSNNNIGALNNSGNLVNIHNNNNNADPEPRKSSTYVLHGHKHTHIEVRDHCHRQRSEGIDGKARKKLIIASVLCLFFMICEIIGGVLSNSLAIATDAAHLLTDFASFMISLFAIWIAGRPSTQRMSFGWYRAEVIGAMASVAMIWVITAILVYLAVERVINRNFEVDATIMLITSGLAILVNLIMGLQLQHGHSHSGLSGGHGHSHGGGKKKKQKIEKEKMYSCSADIIGDVPALSLASNAKPPRDVEASPCGDGLCPTPPSLRLEKGAGELGTVDVELPAAGLRTFSYQNSLSPAEVHAEMAAVVAETAAGGHHHGGKAEQDAMNMNVRAAFIHVIGDMVQSVGVFVAALIIFFRPDWAIVDPICTFIFSVIVLFTTFAIMKDALLVLMEGTPSYLHYAEVLDIFMNIEGVKRVHNLRIWALSINKIALSAHLAVDTNTDSKRILEEATTAVHMRYNFFETTIQIEEFTPQMENCKQCLLPII